MGIFDVLSRDGHDLILIVIFYHSLAILLSIVTSPPKWNACCALMFCYIIQRPAGKDLLERLGRPFRSRDTPEASCQFFFAGSYVLGICRLVQVREASPRSR